MSKYMKYLQILFIFAVFIAFPKSSYAIGTAKILEISSTGMSLILDRGQFEGIRIGMKGRFLRPVGDLNRPKFKYLAFAEVIKVHSNYSYWYLSDVNKAEFLDKGQKVVFVTMDETNKGRRDSRYMKRKVVLREGDTPLKYIEEKKCRCSQRNSQER